MKIILRLLLIILIIFAVLLVGKNVIAKTLVEKGVKAVTGLGLTMDKLNIGFMNTLVHVQGLKVLNPDKFVEKKMVDMPEIFVDYNLPAIIKGKIHLEEVRLNLNELVVVKNQAGELNLDSLKTLQQKSAQPAETPAKPAEAAKAPEIQIDKLSLKVGKAVFKDYSKGGEPDVKEFPVNLDEQFENITDPNDLVKILVLKTLLKTPIAGLANFDLGNLTGFASDTLKQGEQMLKDNIANVQQAALNVINEKVNVDSLKEATSGLIGQDSAASEAVNKAQDAVASTASAIEGKLSGLTEKVKIPSFGFGGGEADTTATQVQEQAQQVQDQVVATAQ